MDRHAQRHEEIDKELRAIRKILNIGARQLARLEEISKEHGEKINILIDAQMRLTEAHAKLAEAQARTEVSLQAFIDSMRKGNGRRAAR